MRYEKSKHKKYRVDEIKDWLLAREPTIYFIEKGRLCELWQYSTDSETRPELKRTIFEGGVEFTYSLSNHEIQLVYLI